MRLSVNVPEALGQNLRREAGNRGVSISSLVSTALDYYLVSERRRALGKKVLDLAGNTSVSADADRLIEEGRRDDRT